MLDPEFPDAGIGVAESEAVGGFGMGEAGGVEVDADAQGFGPIDPAGEVFKGDGIAVDFFAGEFAINGVEVDAVFAGDERKGFFEIGAEFVGGAGLAGVIAGGGDAAAEGDACRFQSRRRHRPASSGC